MTIPIEEIEGIIEEAEQGHFSIDDLRDLVAKYRKNETPDVDGGETISFDAETNIEVVDIGDELVEIHHTPVVDEKLEISALTKYVLEVSTLLLDSGTTEKIHDEVLDLIARWNRSQREYFAEHWDWKN